MKIISTSMFKDWMLIQCVAAPIGYESCIGREGIVYRATVSLHGPGVEWIWNMRFVGGSAETPVREGFVFAKPGS